MMSTIEKDAAISEETSIMLDGGDASHYDTECHGEAIAIKTKQNTEEELTSQLAAFISNEELGEDTTMVDKQNGSVDEKESSATDKNKSEEVHNPSVALSKKEVSTTDKTAQEGIEVDAAPSSEEMCVEEESEANIADVVPSKNEMNTAENAVEKSTAAQCLSEVHTTEKTSEEGIEVDAAASSEEMCVEEESEANIADVVPSKNEMNTAENAVEKSTAAQCLSEVHTTEKTSEEGIEVDAAASSEEMCVEEESEANIADVVPSKNEMNTAENAVEKSTAAQCLSEVHTTEKTSEEGIEVDAAASSEEMCVEEESEANIADVVPSKNEMNTAENAVEKSIEAQCLSEVDTTEKTSEEGIEVDAAASSEEMCVEEESEANIADVVPSKNKMNAAEQTIEKSTEAQCLSEVDTTEKTSEKNPQFKNLNAAASKEVSIKEEGVEKNMAAQNFRVALLNKEENTTEKSADKPTEAENLSAPPLSSTDKAAEKVSEVQKLGTMSSNKKVSTMEEVVEKLRENQHFSVAAASEEVSTTDEVEEKRSETQNLSALPLMKKISSTDKGVEKKSEDQKLSTMSSNKKVSTMEEVVQKLRGTQNLSTAPFRKKLSNMGVEKRLETQNCSAMPSNEDSTTEEAVERSETENLIAAPFNIEVSTIQEASKQWMETPNFSALTIKAEVFSTDEAGEEKTEDQQYSAASSNKQASIIEKTAKKTAQRLITVPARKGKILKAAVPKRIKCQNVGVALPKRKMSTPEMAEDAGVSHRNEEMSTIDEENNPSVCGPSGVKAAEESKASTSASCSRSDPDISVLRNIPRNSNIARVRLLRARRAFQNRQARRTQRIHCAINGKTIAPKRPRVPVPRVHVTAEAFPSLASELYSLLPESFKDAVSLSMLEYYMMILYHHRLAGLRMNRRTPLSQDEVLCSNLELGPLFVPEIFEQWITMRGHDVNTRGEAIRLILPPLPSDAGDFGRVSVSTHWRYISDLAPRVFRDRIAADLQHTLSSGPVEWDLHEDIRPQEKNCGLPTRNLIGYHVAQKLTPSQIDELHLCGIGLWNDKTVFPVDVDAECYHLNVHLVRAVSQHFAALGPQFRIVRHAQYDSQPSSAGLIVYAERMVSETEEYLFDRNVGHYEYNAKVRAYAPVAMDKELAKGAVVFLPRVYRRDGKRPINRSWCAYDFGFYFMVPDEWTATRNNAYKQGTWQSWHTPHLTTASITRASLLKPVVKRLVLSQERTP